MLQQFTMLLSVTGRPQSAPRMTEVHFAFGLVGTTLVGLTAGVCGATRQEKLVVEGLAPWV